jgi:hypothetical protein
MPVTLLDLYRQSDAIFEARFDKTREGNVVREDADYSVVRINKLFDVYSTLKGSHSKFLVLTEDEYRYAQTQSPNYLVAALRANEEVENTYGLRSGDSVLLFLKYGKDGKTLELTDDEEGLKKLSPDELSVYEKRIHELGALLSSESVSATAIVDWMMRCAEEPATRWEATFELVKGFERLDWQRKQKQAAEDNDAEKRGLIAVDQPDFFDSTTFAQSLTDEQKHKLADILLDRSPQQITASGESTKTMVRGDRELIDLVKHWGDPRLAGFLLDELKTRDLTEYRRSETMRLIADMLRDERIIGLADKYSNAYRDEAIAKEFLNEQGLNSVTDNAAKADYNEMRAAIMAKFIKRVNAVVTSQPNIEN